MDKLDDVLSQRRLAGVAWIRQFFCSQEDREVQTRPHFLANTHTRCLTVDDPEGLPLSSAVTFFHDRGITYEVLLDVKTGVCPVRSVVVGMTCKMKVTFPEMQCA